MIVNLEEKLSQGEQMRPKSSIGKDVRSSQLENQVHEMNLYVNELEQKLSMKEYEINTLKDKIQYLEEELHKKNDEIFNHNQKLQDKLSKIESDIAVKQNQPVSSPVAQQPSSLMAFSFEQDYENRIREYQRSIQSKNNEIKILEERISETESEKRKVSLDRSSSLKEWQDKMDKV